MLASTLRLAQWSSNTAAAASNSAYTGVSGGQTSNIQNAYIRESGTAAAPSVAFSNSANCGMFLPGSNQLGLTAGGFAAVTLSNRSTTVNSNLFCMGNLGVGNSNPAARLHVSGTAWASNVMAISQGTASAPAFSWTASSNTGLFMPSTNQIGFAVGGSNVLFLMSNAVGINTLNPTSALDVVGTVRATGSVLSSNVRATLSGTAVTPAFSWTSSSNTGMFLPSTNQIGFAVGGSNVLFLMSNAVGINTLNPTNALDVVGTVSATGSMLGSNVRSASSGTSSTPAFSWASSTSTGMFLPASNKIGFAAGGSNVLCLTSNAVGINTATPANALDVVGTVSATGSAMASNVRLLSSGTVSAPAVSWSSSTNTGLFLPSNNQVGFAVAGCNVLFLTSNAMGINTSNLSHTLEVSGTISASGTVTQLSDSNLKSDFNIIPDCLAKLDSIHGYSFQFINDLSATRHVGVIAQEIQTVLPEVVDTQGPFLSVAYGNISALLINALKELKELHVQDKAHLQEQIDDLYSRLTVVP
ncbi:hypothetical protein TSOC_000489 [Tetrabaena socialis]|uniref:Peptidase S74 domain-containing protein n=1 Tax=Tetrabaena socialis TaxID=47790 RepID=A0A2J8AJA2_9CHLO|nr:hypothetical protein TSOC_000489 [Tetrabaena socialis]|eukprot:PNH12590.1 hypothetical protein TSOC_000489 [Tetrabaena socialis]